MSEPGTVFVQGLGFRPNRGVRLAEPVTVAKDGGHAVRVMSFLSTEVGTEVAFEFRDSERETECFAAPSDQRWTTGTVRICDSGGAVLRELPPGRGHRVSVGANEFGFLRREVIFEPMADDARSVALELRGELGEWDVPLELVPIGQTSVAPGIRIDAKQERNGITVRIRTLAETSTAIYLELDATATSPAGTVVGIGSWMQRSGDQRLVIVDEHGRQFEEIFSRGVARGMTQEGGRTTAAFAPLPENATRLTLVVPKVTVRESQGSLAFALPVFAPADMRFGPYPVIIRWADVVDDVRTAPGETPTRGIQLQFRRGDWRDERRVLWPGRFLVDGTRVWNYGLNHADPEALSINIRLRPGEEPKTVTLFEPLVEVRGPWEVRWEKSS